MIDSQVFGELGTDGASHVLCGAWWNGGCSSRKVRYIERYKTDKGITCRTYHKTEVAMYSTSKVGMYIASVGF